MIGAIVFLQARVLQLEDSLDDPSLQINYAMDMDEAQEPVIGNDAAVEGYEDHSPYVVPDIMPGYADDSLPRAYADMGAISEEQLEYVLARLNSIDGMTDGIIGVFRHIAEMESIPFEFDEGTLRGNIGRALGGRYVGAPADIVAGLDVITSDWFDNMSALAELAYSLEEYFMARPIGWPVASRNVTSEFGYRVDPFTGTGLEMHEGIDIQVPVGTEVFATAYGVVEFAGWHATGYGYLVVIVHDFGYSTFFAHNSEILVTLGQEVERGQLIALSGDTGRSTAPHVHYEVRYNGEPMNPREFMG
jgi:murein DD-endopeptidase MepM/ murein hydrolase activator NlpD